MNHAVFARDAFAFDHPVEHVEDGDGDVVVALIDGGYFGDAGCSDIDVIHAGDSNIIGDAYAARGE